MCMLSLLAAGVRSQDTTTIEFENIFDAVGNMGVGWNLGNTLDCNSGDTLNMWIEHWNAGPMRTPSKYETAWGQPVTKPALFKMLKEAGFNAVRIPVTWYPHLEARFSTRKVGDKICWYPSKDDLGTKIDPAWMKRVHEVVDYALDAGLYCIINVHHDTGAANTAWLIADSKVYEKEHERFEAVWTQIAEEFRDYDEHLLFEGYNEMLDSYRSWCYATMNTPGQYDTSAARKAYNAINSYAQSFVNAVRSTGGNNLTRNLIVSTYAASSGYGDWSNHLTDPISKMTIPDDTIPGHIALEIHAYIDVKSWGNALKRDISDWMRKTLYTNIIVRKNVPVIIGEWGTSDVDSPDASIPRKSKLEYASHMVSTAKTYGIATFYWMGLSDRSDRSVPKWTEPDLVDAIIKGYYGAGGYDSVDDVVVDDERENVYYNLMGQLVAEPLRPGLYICNGRKVLITE